MLMIIHPLALARGLGWPLLEADMSKSVKSGLPSLALA
jgi:hypothetical protein